MNTLTVKTYVAAFALLALFPLATSLTPFSATQAVARNAMDEPNSGGFGGHSSPIDGDIAAKMDRSTGTKQVIQGKRPIMRDRSCYPNCTPRGPYSN